MTSYNLTAEKQNELTDYNLERAIRYMKLEGGTASNVLRQFELPGSLYHVLAQYEESQFDNVDFDDDFEDEDEDFLFPVTAW